MGRILLGERKAFDVHGGILAPAGTSRLRRFYARAVPPRRGSGSHDAVGIRGYGLLPFGELPGVCRSHVDGQFIRTALPPGRPPHTGARLVDSLCMEVSAWQ